MQPAALRTSTTAATTAPATPAAPAQTAAAAPQLIGRVLAVNGSQATIGLLPAQTTGPSDARATVGKFLSIHSVTSMPDRHDHRCLG